MEYSLGLVEVSALGNAIIMLDDMLKAALKLVSPPMTDADAATKAAEICATVNALPQGEHFDLKFVATVTDTPLTRADDTAIAGRRHS